MGSSSHDPAVCNLEAHCSVTALQACVRKQSIPHQAYLRPSIQQDICDNFFLSAHYLHLQVQLPLIAMWCMDNSHSMQL